MDNVIDFPTKAVRDRALIEKSIEDLLDQTTADQKAKCELTARLLSLFETYQQDYSLDFSFDCPPPITQAQADIIGASIKENFDRFEEMVHNHMNTILLERFHAEITLYFLESKRDCLKGQ